MHFTNHISALFEKFASYAFAPKIQSFINGLYVRIFNISLEEFDTIQSYPTLNALFTRSLVKTRSFDKSEGNLIAPCDSIVLELGACENNTALQIKGKSYVLSDFVKEQIGNDYSFVNFYLSPSDYHRFHAPLNLAVESLEFINGKLLSVSEKSLRKNDSVFTQNKRVVLKCKDDFDNILYFVAIGALNVGKIQINFAPEVANLKESKKIEFNPPIKIKKGDEMGAFLMGSTIVLLSKNYCYDLKINEKVYFGQCIAKVENDKTN